MERINTTARNSYCHKCNLLCHEPITCRAKSVCGYQVIDLVPPLNINNPITELELEYTEAINIIKSLIPNPTQVSSIKLIVNQVLELRYYNRKQEIEREIGRTCEEGYYWHGSSHDIYMKIAQGGFKVPGIDPIPHRANGIYTAINHSTSLGYRKNTNSLILSKLSRVDLGNLRH
ncbi:unnamed protein product [Blepharisma stoltei]|uniref:PARP n=1 Tax=Blepharisma stoltei TaxID=1481888 RepID=A0AAU9KBJ5_9CILI|nr:unnamed protein product [Blepharisma stoltei]